MRERRGTSSDIRRVGGDRACDEGEGKGACGQRVCRVAAAGTGTQSHARFSAGSHTHTITYIHTDRYGLMHAQSHTHIHPSAISITPIRPSVSQEVNEQLAAQFAVLQLNNQNISKVLQSILDDLRKVTGTHITRHTSHAHSHTFSHFHLSKMLPTLYFSPSLSLSFSLSLSLTHPLSIQVAGVPPTGDVCIAFTDVQGM